MSPATPKLADPGALIRGGKLPEKDYPVCVEPDLVAEYEQLVGMREAAKEAGAGSLAGGNASTFDEQIADVQRQMEASTVVLKLRALGRLRWKALRDEHPPRKEADGKPDLGDLRLGVNRDTFFDPFIRETIVDPVLDEETLTLLIEQKLTDGQWEDLTTAAWNLNEAKISVPLSSAASPSRRSTSKR
jgi:hypothetical protein